MSRGQDRSMSQEHVVFFLSITSSRVTNLGCEDCRKCKIRLQPSGNTHLMKRVLDIGRAHKPVSRSLKLDMAKSLACEQRSRWRPQKMSVARTHINNESLSTSLLGNEKETDVFHNRFNNPNWTSLCPITNEAHVVTSAVLELEHVNWRERKWCVHRRRAGRPPPPPPLRAKIMSQFLLLHVELPAAKTHISEFSATEIAKNYQTTHHFDLEATDVT